MAIVSTVFFIVKRVYDAIRKSLIQFLENALLMGKKYLDLLALVDE